MLKGTSKSYAEYVEGAYDEKCGMWKDAGMIELEKWYGWRTMGQL